MKKRWSDIPPGKTKTIIKGGKSISGVELAEELDGDRFAGLCSIYAGERIAE